jgi:hypothetical protein
VPVVVRVGRARRARAATGYARERRRARRPSTSSAPSRPHTAEALELLTLTEPSGATCAPQPYFTQSGNASRRLSGSSFSLSSTMSERPSPSVSHGSVLGAQGSVAYLSSSFLN